ncbi:MAG: spermidine/putrescine ABC transporter substrate-binding protein [Ruminococcaceae bacterium]|nr:spermidine/putrescine ABC transporter substrate-binding protein [Oscillospiraceae bacterium]
MKKIISTILCTILTVCLVFVLGGCSSKTKLFVYNVGDYIHPDVIDMFEAENPDIKVVYELFDSVEEMYMKVSNGTSPYDVAVPSDYMIEQMIDEGLLNKINFDNVPNYSNVDSNMRNLDFDPTNEYSVPYMWGTIGILYNKTMVDEPVDSWDILWDEKYKDNIFLFNQERDMVSVALKKCGYSMNSDDDAELSQAEAALKEQSDLVKAYCGDEIKDNMINGGAALAVVWSGDAYFCMEQNPDLAYVIPNEGSNLWFDCMVIPKTSTHQEEAEKFIDFMSRPDIAKLNAEYIGYSTANEKARELLADDVKNDKMRYPSLDEDFMSKMEIFAYNKSRNAKLADIWTRVLNS